MKKLTQHVGNLIIYLIELLVGILLLVDPLGFTTGILIITGGALTVLGALSILRYFRIKPDPAKMEYNLAVGLIEATVGLFCIFRSEWIIDKISIITILYGIGVLVVGFLKIQNAVDLLRLKIRIWPFAAINAVLTLIFSVVVLAKPFDAVMTFLAIALIVVAVLDIAALVLSWRKPNGKLEIPEGKQNEEEEDEE